MVSWFLLRRLILHAGVAELLGAVHLLELEGRGGGDVARPVVAGRDGGRRLGELVAKLLRLEAVDLRLRDGLGLGLDLVLANVAEVVHGADAKPVQGGLAGGRDVRTDGEVSQKVALGREEGLEGQDLVVARDSGVSEKFGDGPGSEEDFLGQLLEPGGRPDDGRLGRQRHKSRQRRQNQSQRQRWHFEAIVKSKKITWTKKRPIEESLLFWLLL